MPVPEAPEDERDFEGEGGSGPAEVRDRAVDEWRESPSIGCGRSAVLRGTWSRGLKSACLGSFGSTIPVVDVVLPKRLIFFARAARDERRRSKMEGGGWVVEDDGLVVVLALAALLGLGGLCCDEARIAAFLL